MSGASVQPAANPGRNMLAQVRRGIAAVPLALPLAAIVIAVAALLLLAVVNLNHLATPSRKPA